LLVKVLTEYLESDRKKESNVAVVVRVIHQVFDVSPEISGYLLCRKFTFICYHGNGFGYAEGNLPYL
jgi:hypothetical protein